MPVTYIPPLVRAWERTRALLFRPFSAETWIVIGFAAFLARLAEGGAVTGSAPKWSLAVDDWSPLRIGEELLALVFILPLVAFALVIGVALLWISSRGQLVFLDDVLAARGAIVEPWTRHGRLGDSLFLWRVALYGVTIAAILAALTPLAIYGRLADLRGAMAALGGLGVAASFTLVTACVIAACFVALLLESFVVPLMYRYRTGASAAWRRLLPLLREAPLSFVLYALFVLGLWIAVVTAIVVVGCLTCCIPFIPLSIPYLNTLVLLPFLVWLRLYSVEFLAQFGEAFAVVRDPTPLISPPGPPGPIGS